MDLTDQELLESSEAITTFRVQSTLNPRVWSGKTIKPAIRKQLLAIAKDFLDDDELPAIGTPEITMTGSLANYNWSSQSDVDLHLVAKFDGADGALKRQVCQLKSGNWNKAHDIQIENFPVELYVQDAKEPHYSTGVYSLTANKWIREPSRAEFEKVIDWNNVHKKAERIITQIDHVAALVKRGEFSAAQIEATHVRDRLKRQRAAGLEAGGELSVENLVFKTLRRSGDIERLLALKQQAYDCSKSLASTSCGKAGEVA